MKEEIVKMGVEEEWDIERDERKNVEIEDLEVIEEKIDDIKKKVIVEEEIGEDIGVWLREEKKIDIRIIGIINILEIGMSNEVLIGIEKRIMSKEKEIRKNGVKLKKGKEERIIGNDLRKDEVIVRIGKRKKKKVKDGMVGSIGVKKEGIIRGIGLLDIIKEKRIILNIIGEEIVGNVKIGSSEGMEEDGRKRKMKWGIDERKIIWIDNEEMEVIVVDERKIEKKRSIEDDGKGSVEDKKVKIKGLKRSEKIFWIERSEIKIGRIKEDRRR